MINHCSSWWWQKKGRRRRDRNKQSTTFVWQTNHKEPLPALPAALWRERNLRSLPRGLPASHPGGMLTQLPLFLHRLRNLASTISLLEATDASQPWSRDTCDASRGSDVAGQTCPKGQCHAPSWERAIIKADILPIEKKGDKPGLSDPGQTVALASHVWLGPLTRRGGRFPQLSSTLVRRGWSLPIPPISSR